MTTATLRQRDAGPARLLPKCALRVERSEIRFADAGPGRVGVAITVRNLGDFPSSPTHALLQSAPLGAFVPWQPLAILPVPAIEPGGSFVLRTDAARPRPKPLGPPDRLPPRQLLTALGAEDDRPQVRNPLPANTLAPDLHELLGHRNAHWAGNLNVFVNTQPVERHMAQALRVYPDRLNLAMFVVGSRQADAYRFHVVGDGSDWGAKLHDMTAGQSFALDVRREPPIEEGRWIEASGARMMMLALTPASDCGPGNVAVHVRQRSTGQEAVVEFSLDPNAAGPGCFVV